MIQIMVDDSEFSFMNGTYELEIPSYEPWYQPVSPLPWPSDYMENPDTYIRFGCTTEFSIYAGAYKMANEDPTKTTSAKLRVAGVPPWVESSSRRAVGEVYPTTLWVERYYWGTGWLPERTSTGSFTFVSYTPPP